MAKQVLIFVWGIKMVNFCQQVPKSLSSYTPVFTVFINHSHITLSMVFLFLEKQSIDAQGGARAQELYAYLILSEKFTRNSITAAKKANKTLDVIFYSFTTCMKSKITLIKVSRNNRFGDAEFAQVGSPRGL